MSRFFQFGHSFWIHCKSWTLLPHSQRKHNNGNGAISHFCIRKHLVFIDQTFSVTIKWNLQKYWDSLFNLLGGGVPINQLFTMCISYMQLSWPSVYISITYPIRCKSESGGQEDTFQVNLLMHLDSLMLCYDNEGKVYFCIPKDEPST